MNRKQLTLLFALVVVLGGLGLLVSNRQTSSWRATGTSAGQKLLPEFPMNDITRITITQGTTNLSLAKQDDLWRVEARWNYPANFTEISDLLRKFWELKVVRSLQVGPSKLGQLELLDPGQGTNSGTFIEFKDKSGKAIHSVLLGKKYSRGTDNNSQFGGGDFPMGRYILAKKSSSDVALVSEPFSEVEAKPDRWLNKDFFKIEKLRSISVVSTNATNSWKLIRDTEGGDLKLADKKEGEEFDTSKASSVGYALSSPSFNDIVSPDAKPDETGMDQPLTATLETFENFTYAVKIGKKTDDDNYRLQVSVKADIEKQRTPGKDEKPEDKEKLDKEFQDKVKKLEDKLKQEQAYEKWTYLVSKWTIDPILKERKDFFAEKKAENQAAQPGQPPSGVTLPNPVEADPFKPAPAVPIPEANKPDSAEKKSTEELPSATDKGKPVPPVPESKQEEK